MTSFSPRYLEHLRNVDPTATDGQLLVARVTDESPRPDYAHINPFYWDLKRDFGAVDNASASASVAQANGPLVQAFADRVAETGIEGWVPIGNYGLYSTVRTRSNSHISGVPGLSRFYSHPEYASNGPLFANDRDENGDYVPLERFVLNGVDFDGRYLDNAFYNVRCTLTAPITPASTTYEVDTTAGFDPAGGRVSLTPLGDDIGRFTYTSLDATHFYGCVQQTDDDHLEFSADAGTEFRRFDSTMTGLFRLYSYDSVEISDCHFQRSASYLLAAEGRPYDPDPSKRGPKHSLLLLRVRLTESYMSDGLDIKDQEHLTAIHCEAEDCYDKGFNVRGRYQVWVNCVAKRCRSNFGLTSSPAVGGEERTIKRLTAGISKTDMVLPVASTSGMDGSGYGYIAGTERVHWSSITPTTIVLDQRALDGTRRAAHAIEKQFVADWPVADQEVAAGMIDLFGCHVDGGLTGFSLNAGGSYTRANVFGGTVKNCTLGMQAISALGPMEISVHGTSFYNNQTNVKLTRCISGRLFGIKATGARGNLPGDPGTDTPGDGMVIEDCPNGTQLYGCILDDNAAVGLRTTGTTDYVHADGPIPYGNTSQPMNIGAQCTNITGSWFGVATEDFQPMTVQETIPVGRAASKLALVSGTVYAAAFTARGALPVAELFCMVTDTGSPSPTVAKLALLELDGTSFTKVAQVDNHPGGVFITTGDKDNLTLENTATYWLTPGRRYAIAVLQVGMTATAPQIAAFTPAVASTPAWRQLRAGTVAAVSNDIPASGTLTPTTVIPYLAAVKAG